ncbi:MAG: DNA mismatch repair protein MutS [Acidobacteria bacterium]|nr:DNA mismatch repair protein MutS [Acidobacteriota bacterium]
MENLTPLMRQYHEIKAEHPGMLVFFRLGDFYEMFYEDAVLASRELEITLTSRHNDRDGTPVPMCGVPHHSVNHYLARLIRKGYKVALCEQVEGPGSTRTLMRREVTRIITPGTAVEEGLLEPKENNYIAALIERSGRIGASFLDLSTGEFWLSELSGEGAWKEVHHQLLQFSPRELVLPDAGEQELAGRLTREVLERSVRSLHAAWSFNLDYAERVLCQHFQVSTLEGFGVNGHGAAVSAAGALLNYLHTTQKSQLSHVRQLRYFEPRNFLKLDETTISNLELLADREDNRKWSLYSVLDFTRTGMGARRLRSWVLRPSLDLTEIQGRLDAVEELAGSVMQSGKLAHVLEGIQDLERLLSRVTLETANARDLLAIKSSLEKVPELGKLLLEHRSPLLQVVLDPLEDVTATLARALTEDPPAVLNEGGLIRAGFNSELDELREIARSGKSFLARMETEERARTGIASLKVKYNKVFGYFLEVTRPHLSLVPADYIRQQTLVGAERFVTPQLKEHEQKVLGAEERMRDLEKELFCELRRQVGREAARIQSVVEVIARVDVLLALAEAARKHRYVRPQLNEGLDILIRNGRHPVVERRHSEPFVPNDLYCNGDTNQLLILTGPNMGGKSTYLRQNALIVILAQMGSFVPADEARIGLVDQIFTRVGASDNLSRGQSTFLVEMIETAHILNTATPRSFILLDEVGRGTATFDGLSIAWSVAEHVLTQRSCGARTLFATHYHELTKLEKLYPGVKNYCVTVRESGQKIIFFHRVLAGTANKSYGIEVARLAGLPLSILERAREILSRLEQKEINLAARPRQSTEEILETLQRKLF